MSLVPFEQLRFESLPASPFRPHDYFLTEAHDLAMSSESFGEMLVHYRCTGEGPPLLLIHGLMTSSYSWRYLLRPLAKHFRLYIPDLPGAGKSSKILGRSYDPKNLALWISEFQAACNITGCPIIGNSLGGYLSMQLALRDPRAMSKLINIHSPAFATIKLRLLHFFLRFFGLRKIISAIIKKNPEKWAHQNVHYYDETIKSFEEASEYGRPLRDSTGVETFLAYLYEAMAPGPMTQFVRTLKGFQKARLDFPVPLLLIYARADPMVPPEIGEKLFRLIQSAKLIWLEESSHFAHVDSCDALIEPILDFLKDEA